MSDKPASDPTADAAVAATGDAKPAPTAATPPSASSPTSGRTGRSRKATAPATTPPTSPPSPRSSSAGAKDADTPRPTRQRKRRTHPLWWIAVGLLAAAVITLALMLNHALRVNQAWQTQVDELTDISFDLGTQLTDEREVLAQQASSIDLLDEQLRTVQQRLLDLAAQVARSDDDAVVTEQRITNLEALVESAGSIANTLARCVNSQEQLVELLREAELYDEAELAAFEESVQRQCAAARSGNDHLQESIAAP